MVTDVRSRKSLRCQVKERYDWSMRIALDASEQEVKYGAHRIEIDYETENAKLAKMT